MVMDNRKYHCRDIEKEKTMADNRNALAELAERLDDAIAFIQDDCLLEYKTIFDKARRIVAEVAKVNTLGPKHIPGDISLYTAYAKCRAIAEEGAGESEVKK